MSIPTCFDCDAPQERPILMRIAARGRRGSIRVPLCADCWRKRTFPAYRLALPADVVTASE